MPNRRLTFNQPSGPQPGEIDEYLARGDSEALIKALVGLALASADLDADFRTITNSAIVSHSQPAVRGIAVTCLGHLARIHRGMPEQPTVAIIEKALADDAAFVRSNAEDFMSDVEFYISSLGEKIRRP